MAHAGGENEKKIETIMLQDGEKKRGKREGFQDNIGILSSSFSGPRYIAASTMTFQFFQVLRQHLMDQ
jgi:hypothetical protein